jgi:ammonia channel protein AmtB
LNKNKAQDAVGVTPGHYISGYSGMLATAGGGYQYKITVFEGTYGKGHKVVASGASGVFALGPAPVAAGPPQVTVATPKTGETIPKSGGILTIQFSQKNMDPNKSLSYMPELVRNGVTLGPVFGMSFVLNKNKAQDAVGVTPGHYISGYAGQVAPSGGGYQYRILVHEGTYGQGHKEIASGLSGVFSLGP